MKILVCEDEAPARKQFIRQVHSVREGVEVAAAVETGEEALSAIRKYDLDLIFMDVELADGPCFETLNNVRINVPVIFTTAYDEYALKAFQLNSIDYLVKPISRDDIEQAFRKYDRMKRTFGASPVFNFSNAIMEGKNHKERFLVKLGRKLFPVHTSEIAYFMARDKMVWLVTRSRKKYVINFTLTDLEEVLDPHLFFRLNRQYIVHVESVKELEPHFSGQVAVHMIPPTDEEVIVSRNKTPELKDWLGLQ